MPPRITIVTGFLGSGKTTLLRGLLAAGAGRRVALVVNEIGAVGFDGAALERAGASAMIELTGGCLCCVAGSDLLLAVEDLINMADPDQIVIETTGLAEPGGLIRQVRAAGLALDAVVTVVAADGLEAALAASPVALWQIQAADLLVVSRVDVADAAQIVAVEAQLRHMNPRATIIPAAHGRIDPQLVFGPRLNPSDPLPMPEHRDLDGFSSFVWQSDTPIQRSRLTALLAALPKTIYRVKGLVHCGDAPWPDALHYVAGRLELSAFRPRAAIRPLNQLVWIGIAAHALQEDLVAQLEACHESEGRVAAWMLRYRDLF
ncbi:cobalamin synthesis protein P47K [Oscillochloris trichoides DG-6]|uniref:Cobalamin synthesis protein P47K n=1 Tax=Oscillochloris trichoides DG-6 TaxID=765420 RepID=E1IGG5_9CHLR|nr:GTP-binding protein [Oscillochloris trichoides]EFO79731.1 cobalamin synthesis protein P47K [Oscillochloris trichoides DG-6]